MNMMNIVKISYTSQVVLYYELLKNTSILSAPETNVLTTNLQISFLASFVLFSITLEEATGKIEKSVSEYHQLDKFHHRNVTRVRIIRALFLREKSVYRQNEKKKVIIITIIHKHRCKINPFIAFRRESKTRKKKTKMIRTTKLI